MEESYAAGEIAQIGGVPCTDFKNGSTTQIGGATHAAWSGAAHGFDVTSGSWRLGCASRAALFRKEAQPREREREAGLEMAEPPGAKGRSGGLDALSKNISPAPLLYEFELIVLLLPELRHQRSVG